MKLTRFEDAHDLVFSKRAIEHNPFAAAEWPVALVPYGINMDRLTFEALAAAGHETEDFEISMMDVESLPETLRKNVVLPWNLFTT
jgi:hypothetical protein